MKKLLLIALAAAAGLAAAPAPAAAAATTTAKPCVVPGQKPLWIEYGAPEFEDVFGRTGVIVAGSGEGYPARMRARGATTIFWDMYLSRRVGTPSVPADPAVLPQRANTLFAQSDWKGSLDAYSALAKEFPAHALSRFRVGVSLVGLGRFSEGEAHIREGEKLGVVAGNAAFRLAEVLAEQGKSDAAIAELIPGTISKGTSAARSANASSPPRPKTKGSPPFKRTTFLPWRA